MTENHFAKNTVAVYGINLFLCAVSFNIMQKTALDSEGKDSLAVKVYKNKMKKIISTPFYILGIAISFLYPQISLILFLTVALMSLIPAKRVEKMIK